MPAVTLKRPRGPPDYQVNVPPAPRKHTERDAALGRLARLAARSVGADACEIDVDGASAGAHGTPAGVPLAVPLPGRDGAVRVFADGRTWEAQDAEALRDVAAAVRAELDLRAAEHRFRALAEHLPAVTYTCDYDEAGRVRYMSPQVRALTGLPPEHFIGDPRRWLEIVHPDDRERVTGAIRASLAREEALECEYRVVARDGTVRWVWEREAIVRDEGGRPAYAQGVIVDRTQMRETQEALHATRSRLASIMDVAPMILTAIDADGIIRLAEGQGLQAAGVCADDLVGRPASHLVASDAGRDALRRALAGETTKATIGDGPATFDVTWQPVFDDRGVLQGVVSVGLDVTARRESEAHLRHLAHHDSLTGAPNRSRLEQEIAERGGDLAVVAVDVDGFRTVNDSLGHAAGDEVLRELSRRLVTVADAHGAFLARQGADEFALLIGGEDAGALRLDAEALGHAALAVVRQPIAVAGTEFVLAATAGAALGGDAPGELLRHADIALGDAKRAGTQLAWYGGERGDARGRLTLTARIRGALADGEFRLHYQPILDLAADAVTSVEALIRWVDPERGTVAPDEFIPAAEAAGLIDDIGRWVADEACRQWRAWADQGLATRMSFNVAPRELRRDGFAAALVRTAARHGADPRALVVEITERAAMREPERTDAVLRELKQAGMRVAIDDFGAEHSSLARLRDLDVDILKIDRSFLQGAPTAPEASAIVTSILSLARALGMVAVAEGVETAEQLAFLRAEACPRAQGFHIARPMPAAEATAFLRRHGARSGLREAA